MQIAQRLVAAKTIVPVASRSTSSALLQAAPFLWASEMRATLLTVVLRFLREAFRALSPCRVKVILVRAIVRRETSSPWATTMFLRLEAARLGSVGAVGPVPERGAGDAATRRRAERRDAPHAERR